MSLKDGFEKINAQQEKRPLHERGIVAKHCFSKKSDWMLCYDPKNGLFYEYDFLTRTVTTTPNDCKEGGFDVTQFSKINTEVLEFMRDQLIEMGGTPPALPVHKSENAFDKQPTTKITRHRG